MTPEPLKGKLRFKDEDDLTNYVCEVIFQCSGEQPTESDPSGCCGCDAQEKWFDENYSDMIIDESTDKQFASKKDIKSAVEWLKQRIIKEFVLEEKQFIINQIDEAFEDVMKK